MCWQPVVKTPCYQLSYQPSINFVFATQLNQLQLIGKGTTLLFYYFFLKKFTNINMKIIYFIEQKEFTSFYSFRLLLFCQPNIWQSRTKVGPLIYNWSKRRTQTRLHVLAKGCRFVYGLLSRPTTKATVRSFKPINIFDMLN